MRDWIKKNWPLFTCTAAIVATMLWCTGEIVESVDYAASETIAVKDAVDEVRQAIIYD